MGVVDRLSIIAAREARLQGAKQPIVTIGIDSCSTIAESRGLRV